MLELTLPRNHRALSAHSCSSSKSTVRASRLPLQHCCLCHSPPQGCLFGIDQVGSVTGRGEWPSALQLRWDTGVPGFELVRGVTSTRGDAAICLWVYAMLSTVTSERKHKRFSMAFTSSAATSTVQGRGWGCKPPPVPSLQCPDHTDLPSRLQTEDLPHSAVCRFAWHPGKWNRGFWDVLGGGAVVSDIAG